MSKEMKPSSFTDMPTIVDDFDLDRCSDDAHGAGIEIHQTKPCSSVSSLPQPQKFPTSRNKSHVISDCASRRLIVSHTAVSRRAAGVMINLEEAARWSCCDEDIRNSASHVADLIKLYLESK